jgi:hypothetical protein
MSYGGYLQELFFLIKAFSEWFAYRNFYSLPMKQTSGLNLTIRDNDEYYNYVSIFRKGTIMYLQVDP